MKKRHFGLLVCKPDEEEEEEEEISSNSIDKDTNSVAGPSSLSQPVPIGGGGAAAAAAAADGDGSAAAGSPVMRGFSHVMGATTSAAGAVASALASAAATVPAVTRKLTGGSAAALPQPSSTGSRHPPPPPPLLVYRRGTAYRDDHPLGCIPLIRSDRVSAAPVDEDDADNNVYPFLLRQGDRDWYLCASSPDQRTQWIQALTAATARAPSSLAGLPVPGKTRRSTDQVRSLVRALRPPTPPRPDGDGDIVHDDANLVAMFFKRGARSLTQTAKFVGQPLHALGHHVGLLLTRHTRPGSAQELALTSRTYNQFLECLYSRQEPAPTVAKSMFETVAAFDHGESASLRGGEGNVVGVFDVPADLPPENSRAADFLVMVRETADQLRQAAANSPALFNGQVPDDLIYDCVETHLSQMVYPILFPLAVSGTRLGGSPRDLRIRDRARQLQFVEPTALGVGFAATQARRRAWCLAGAELWQLADAPSPWEKMSRLLDCCRYIYQSLNLPTVVHSSEEEGDEDDSDQQQTASAAAAANSNRKKSPAPAWNGADDFLPILVFVVLRSNPPRLASEISFITEHRNPSVLDGEEGYYLISFETAVSFIERCQPSDLNMDPDQFAVQADQSSAAALAAEQDAEPGCADSLRQRFGVDTNPDPSVAASSSSISLESDWELIDMMDDAAYVSPFLVDTGDIATDSTGGVHHDQQQQQQQHGQLASPDTKHIEEAAASPTRLVRCSICQKRFVNQLFLTRHMETKHGGLIQSKLGRCSQCMAFIQSPSTKCSHCQ